MNNNTEREKQINTLESYYNYNNTFNSSQVKRQTLIELENKTSRTSAEKNNKWLEEKSKWWFYNNGDPDAIYLGCLTRVELKNNELATRRYIWKIKIH